MKKYLKIISASAVLIAGIFFGVTHVSAMASFFLAPTKSATATTTRAWITAGTGTTTLTLPTPLSLGITTKYDKARVYGEVDATSTAQNSALSMRVEYSMDGIDWFSETSASSSAATVGLMAQDIKFNIATTTAYSNTGSATRMHFSYVIDTPAAFNRVVFYSAPSGPNLSLWAAIQPIKEVQVINQ